GRGGDCGEEEGGVGVNGEAGEVKELEAFGAGVGGEQLLALVETQDGKRVGRLTEMRVTRRCLPQVLEQRDEIARRRQLFAQGSTRCPQRQARVRVFERRQESFTALDGATAARTDRLQRQPLAVVA